MLVWWKSPGGKLNRQLAGLIVALLFLLHRFFSDLSQNTTFQHETSLLVHIVLHVYHIGQRRQKLGIA